jgi:hypothetical protein
MHASQTGPKPPAPKSPLKKQYKAMLCQKEYELVDVLEENYKLLEENESLRRDTELNEKKVLHFKEENRKLAQALRDEKSKSRLIINKLLDKAESVIADANEIKFNAEEKMSATELAIFNERERMKLSVQKEQDYIILFKLPHISCCCLSLTMNAFSNSCSHFNNTQSNKNRRVNSI